MDTDRLVGLLRHAFSAGGPGLGILLYYMTQWGVPAEQQSWVLQAIAWALGAGGPVIGACWGWVANGVRSRILSVKKLPGVCVQVDTDAPTTPPAAVELALDRKVRDVVPMQS